MVMRFILAAVAVVAVAGWPRSRVGAATALAAGALAGGNPTNLVVMNRLGLSASAFLSHLLVPGVCAAVLCALVSARRLNRRNYTIDSSEATPASWRTYVPWRIGAQVIGLLAALQGLVPRMVSGGRRFAAPPPAP